MSSVPSYPSPPTEQEFQAMVESLEQLRLCNYITASMLAFMLYDIVINLKQEVPLVWCHHGKNHSSASGTQHRFRRAKQILLCLLFIFARYYGLVYLTITFIVNNTTGLSVTVWVLVSFTRKGRFEQVSTDPSSCKGYFYYLNLAGTVIYVTVVNVMLAMRINALHIGNRRCGPFLAFLVVGEFLVDLSICSVMAVRTTSEVVSPPPWFPWPGCMITSRVTPTLTLASWLTALSVCTIFCILTVKKLIFDKHDEKLSLQDMLKLPPRTRVLLWDGVMVYFLTFAIVLVSTIVMTVVDNLLSALVVSPLVAIYSYCASRLILNIRVVEDGLCPADVPEDPDSLPPTPFLTLPESDEQPVASTSRV